MKQKTTGVSFAALALFLVASGGLQAGTVSYRYDALHRLTQVDYPDGSLIAYTYDPAGNRLQKVVTAAAPDTDGDGIPDASDADDDNDGYDDALDAFPLDPAEWLDTDGDGIGNNADPDDDNDGYPDADDPDPLDASVVPAAGVGVWAPTSRRFFLDLDLSLAFTLPADAMTAVFGSTTDFPVTGDWNGDGFDELGVWNPTSRRFFLDLNGDDRWTSPAVDTMTAGFGSSDCWPLAGDWLGGGVDRIGVWCPKSRRFFLDADGSGSWTPDDIMTPPYGSTDSVPVTGDWDGDGADQIGIWDPRSRRFYLDYDGDYRWTAPVDIVTPPFGSFECVPLADDWNGDAIDEIGIWCPTSRRFFLDCDGSDAWSAGDCMSAPFGNFDSEPVSGRW